MSVEARSAPLEILRETWSGITPGYHLNKRHWISVSLDGQVPDEEVLRLTAHSYDLVRASLTHAKRAELDKLGGGLKRPGRISAPVARQAPGDAERERPRGQTSLSGRAIF